MGRGTDTAPLDLGFVGIQCRDAPGLQKQKNRESEIAWLGHAMFFIPTSALLLDHNRTCLLPLVSPLTLPFLHSGLGIEFESQFVLGAEHRAGSHWSMCSFRESPWCLD